MKANYSNNNNNTNQSFLCIYICLFHNKLINFREIFSYSMMTITWSASLMQLIIHNFKDKQSNMKANCSQLNCLTNNDQESLFEKTRKKNYYNANHNQRSKLLDIITFAQLLFIKIMANNQVNRSRGRHISSLVTSSWSHIIVKLIGIQPKLIIATIIFDNNFCWHL